MPTVTMIPATKNKFSPLPLTSVSKRKVAGYARVSTDSDEQFTSFEAQLDYYTKYIRAREDWEFVAVYTDEGISATNTKKRDGFNQMVADALAGKIDLIVTKSVSRFARNTVDSLTTVRKLKEHGCEVYFEKENIFTFDSKGELLITIMSSLAQEESRSISENVTWGQRKRFADGKVSMPYKRFLGYEKGEDGKPAVNEKEAEVVRLIYRLFLTGKTAACIGKRLEQMEIPSPGGGEKWSKTTINSILTNEKYKGDALLQKKFTVDFLQKTVKANEGEVPQYYVRHSHPYIIEPDEWDYVQMEFNRRKALGATYSGKSVLSAKLVCGDCGGFFGSKVWHSTNKYRKTIWRCNHKFSGEKCCTPSVDESSVKQAFLKVYNAMLGDKKRVISDCELMREALTDTTKLDEEIARQSEETAIIAELAKTAISENAARAQSQTDFSQRYEGLAQRYEAATARLQVLEDEKQRKMQQSQAMARFIRSLKKQPEVLTGWDDTIWMRMVEKALVHRDGGITFVLYGGEEIKAEA